MERTYGVDRLGRKPSQAENGSGQVSVSHNGLFHRDLVILVVNPGKDASHHLQGLRE